MNQPERRLFLIKELLNEKPEYQDLEIPVGEQAQMELLRSLMNVREPGDLTSELLEIQDEYLRVRAEEKGIVRLEDIPMIGEMYGASDNAHSDDIAIWQGDITRLELDAIVNAANSQMLGCFVPMHTCIDNCIHTYAGMQMRAECAQKMRQLRKINGNGYEQPVAVPVITDGYNLPAKKVIHVVGPIVQGHLTKEHEELLALCYRSCLDVAEKNNLESIAFCCISTGVFMFPNQRAAEIAVKTVCDWLDETDTRMKVVFNVFKDMDLQIYKRCFGVDGL